MGPLEGPPLKRTLVKVYMSETELSVLDLVCSTLGKDRSDALRTILFSYAKEINLITEHVQRSTGDRP